MTAVPLPPELAPELSSVSVPDLPQDVDALTAALAYAKGGINVGPIRHGSKNPGSVLDSGNRRSEVETWRTRTTTDSQVIIDWYAGQPSRGVFLHALGLVIFDVDRPAAVPDWMWKYLDAMPFQRSRRGGDPRKGHYLAACPPGRQFGNSLGKLPKGWGEIRGVGGVVVAAPTRHEFAAEDGFYHWVRTGPVPILAAEIADQLPDAVAGERMADDEEVKAFLVGNKASAKPWLVDEVLRRFAAEAAKDSRHGAALSAVCWITRESAAGVYAAQPALERLFLDFSALIGKDRPAKPEFRRIIAWAIGQMTPERLAQVRAEHGLPPAPGEAPPEAIQTPKPAPMADVLPMNREAVTDHAPAQHDVADQSPLAAWDTPPDDGPPERTDEDIERALLEHDARIELRKLRARERALELKAEQDAAGQTYDDRFYDVTELGRLPIPEPLIDGVLDQHTYVVLRGRDGSYKSFTALDWALCLATGTPWMGRAVVPTRVMWLAGEGAYGTRKRILAWEQARGIKVPAGALTLRSGAVNFFRGGPPVNDFVHRVRTGGYGFVVLDTLRTISGGADGNASKDMGDVVDMIKLTREAAEDGTVLVVSHTDKGDGDTRGASNVEDDADGVWHAKPDEDGSSLLTLKCTKVKDGASGLTLNLRMRVVELNGLARADGRPETSLVIEPGAAVTKAPVPESVNETKVMVALVEASATGLTERYMAEALGMPKSSVNRAVNALAKAQQIRKRGVFWFPAMPVQESSSATRWEAS